MKKLITIIAFLMFFTQSNAQLLTETFDTALNWTVARMSGTSTNAGWTRQTAGTAPPCSPFAGAGLARFNSYSIAAGNSYRLTSPAITYAGANYRVGFKMYRDSNYDTDADNIKVYHNTTATNVGGTLLGTVNRSTALAPAVAAEGWYSYEFNLPAGLSGTGYITFLATSFYGTDIYIDSVTVSEIVGNDTELSTLNMPSIIPDTAVGNTTITGTFKNYGANVINTVDLSWQIDSGAINTQTLTGLNLAPNAVYNYSHSVQWNATPGLYTLKVSVGVDDNLTNNLITKMIAVASNQTAKFPLFEKFSSSTCGPCASFNNGTFNPFMAAGTNNIDSALICYQVNWPGTGDPYYTAEVGTRRAYYGVSAAPTLFLDAKVYNSGGLQATLDNERTLPSYFTLNATKNLVGTNMTVNIDVMPYLTGTYKVHVAVVEKTTTGNVGTNGETEWHNVLMKMMPNASGTTISTTHNVAVPTITITTDLAGLFIEDMTDLEVIVFVQSTTSDRGVMQAKVAPSVLSSNEFEAISKIKFYPNPSTGMVKINTEIPVDVVVSDVTGKIVFSMKEVTNETTMNLSDLQKGIYFAKIVDGLKEQTQKIILK